MNQNNHGIYLTFYFLLAVHDNHYIRDTFFPFYSDVSCVNPPQVENAIIQNQKSRYQSGERACYECIANYDLFGEIDVVCLNGTWTKTPLCKGRVSYSPCPPNLENILRTKYIDTKLGWSSFSGIIFRCKKKNGAENPVVLWS